MQWGLASFPRIHYAPIQAVTDPGTHKRPNILWICTDQQRFDTLGCYGNPFVRTPNIDRLAESGVLFDHCYCQSPVCTPSRVSFLTGRYPRTTRCRQNGQSIPHDEVLVTRLLADAGTTGGLSGKLHISACHPKVAPAMERRVDDGYAEFHWSHHPDPEWPTNEYFHWLREQGVTYERVPFAGSRYVQVSVPPEYHQTTWCAQKAVDLMTSAASFDRPWLFSVNFYDPHHPFDPPLQYLQRYLDLLDAIPLPNYTDGELLDKPVFQQIDHRAAYNMPGNYPYADMSGEDHRLVRAAYWAMIDLVDEQVGRMLKTLEETGQLESSLVVFMSDHGEMLGDHGIYLKGPYFYEPAVRVPLIVSWPGTIAAGRRSDALVELVDLAPTLLEASGLPVYAGMQGRSLWPLLTGESELDRHREDVYCEYYNAMPWHKNPTPQATMLRTDGYKLVAMHGLGTGELYDLRQDPTETRNLWHDERYTEVKLALLERLCDRMAWTVDPLPLREANW
ncbi:MAG: sulfatase-like hydrolase/transferase [Chloroflexota bacterium]|nr:sulfatase-like hydrolase/transferase [Chloroflexota bacterium]